MTAPDLNHGAEFSAMGLKLTGQDSQHSCESLPYECSDDECPQCHARCCKTNALIGAHISAEPLESLSQDEALELAYIYDQPFLEPSLKPPKAA